MTAALLALHARTFSSLRKHRNYRLFFGGQVVSLSGTWMQNVALAWFVVELTHSPVAVGVLAFCRFVPFTIFGLVAGVVADRLDNRRLVMVTQTASMIVSAALAALAFSLATLPLQNALSRRYEAEADWIALQATGDPDAAIGLDRRLTASSLGDPDPPAWARLVLSTHPPALERIAMAEAYRARLERAVGLYDQEP